MNFIANRLKRIKPSMTVGINVKANALRAEGKDVLVLAAGEPDFDTPLNIRKAAVTAMEEGQTSMFLVKEPLHYKKQYNRNS